MDCGARAGGTAGRFLARTAVGHRDREGIFRRRELVLEVPDPGGEHGDVVLELEDPADPFQADAGRGQVGDLAQQLDVAPRVAAPTATGPAGRDQPDAGRRCATSADAGR